MTEFKAIFSDGDTFTIQAYGIAEAETKAMAMKQTDEYPTLEFDIELKEIS